MQRESEPLNRIQVLQAIIDRIGARTYLEIGVRKGATFLKIRARTKLAVDPDFRIGRRARILSLLTNPTNLSGRFFAMTSDEFFARSDSLLSATGLDVVFVDGLHTHDQSLKDVLNSLGYLTERGVIVLHDSNPMTRSMASSSLADALQHGSVAWSGDVWKTIVHLRSHRPDLTTFVLDCDTGLGIVHRRRDTPADPIRVGPVGNLDFADLESDRERLLGIKPPSAFGAFLAEL